MSELGPKHVLADLFGSGDFPAEIIDPEHAAEIVIQRLNDAGFKIVSGRRLISCRKSNVTTPGRLASTPGGPGALSNRESHEGLGLRRKEFQKPGASLSCARPAAPREAHNGIDAGWSDGSRSIRNGVGGDQAGD